MRRFPSRSIRVVSFEAGTPCLSRFTFGSLQVSGMPTDVEHYVRRRRSSAGVGNDC